MNWVEASRREQRERLQAVKDRVQAANTCRHAEMGPQVGSLPPDLVTRYSLKPGDPLPTMFRVPITRMSREELLAMLYLMLFREHNPESRKDIPTSIR